MPKMLDDVKDFHEKFGLEYDGPPRELPADLRQFRERFIREELEEYLVAHSSFRDRDFLSRLEHQLDALVDLAYVLFGTVYLAGMSKPFMEAWDRVHAANMKKVRAAADDTSGRNPTFNVVKPPGWSAPVLRDLVEDGARIELPPEMDLERKSCEA